MSAIQIEVSNTERSLDEAAKLTRRRYFWCRTILSGTYHTYLLVPGIVAGWIGARGLIEYYYQSEKDRRQLSILFCLAMVAAPFALAAFILMDVRRERRVKRAMYGPIQFTFTDEGISGIDADGFTFSDSWSCYLGFHAGSSVIVCPKKNSDAYLRIPSESLQAGQLRQLLVLLVEHLPNLSFAALRARSTVYVRS
jgi:hypothetical protein